MRLWGYYAIHSFVNTLKKLFRSTFVVVILAIVGFGLIFGTAAGIEGSVADRQSGRDSGRYEDYEESGRDSGNYEDYEESGRDSGRYEDYEESGRDSGRYEDNEESGGAGTGAYDGVDGLDGDEAEQEEPGRGEGSVDAAVIRSFAESAVAAVFILGLLWGLYSGSKKGSDIFLMADVNFLFTAPMKPQSVLLFRLTFQMAAAMFASVYLLAQIPNLINLGLGAPAIAAVFAGWGLFLLFQRLMTVLSYTLCATHERLKKYLLPFIVGIVLALLAAAAFLYVRAGLDAAAALDALHAGGWSRWIPIIGWYKGMIMSAFEGDLAHFLVFLLLLLCSIAVFVWLIWRLEADFYEDALTQAGRRAERLAAAKEGRTMRVKERPKRIRRAGSFGGCGGSVFFTKAMYERRRTARFGFVTVTMLVNLAASVLVTMFMQRMSGESSFFVTGVVLMGILFFRNFGNPVAQEASLNWLFLVPDNPYRKVFFTMLAGSACCAMDTLPALAAGMLLTHGSLPVMLLWFLVLLVTDFMLSAFGAFLEAVLPASAMDAVKSILRLMLHCFMVLVVTVLMAAGFLLGGILPALALTSAGCAVVGGAFFLIYPGMLHGGVN